MGLREDYTSFLRERLASRRAELRATLTALVDDPPPPDCQVVIELFPDDGLTESPPISVHVFKPDGEEDVRSPAAAASNERFAAMAPLLTTGEVDRFSVWEGEGSDRMVALDQPTDGVDEPELRSWVREAWRELDTRGYHCRTVIAVHDIDGAEIVTRG